MTHPLITYLASRGIAEHRLQALADRFARGPTSVADLAFTLDLPLAEAVELMNDFTASRETHH